MKYTKPNLPKTNVKDMLVSSIISEEIYNELKKLGINPLSCGKTNRIVSELAYHPDILAFNYKAGKWISEEDNSLLPDNMNNLLTSVRYRLGNKYPADCIFNSFAINNNIFCGRVNYGPYTNIKELSGYNLITFKQGYAKCSVIIINENSFITGDKSIEKKLKEIKYDCLYVTNECIGLNGFKNGFIGGCAGKASKDLLLFTGNIKLHNDYENIKAFCRNYDVDIYSLSNRRLYDYGGLLPVTETE